MRSCFSFKGNCATSFVWILPSSSFPSRRQHFCTKIAVGCASDGVLVQGALSSLDVEVIDANTYASLLRNPAISRSLHGGRQLHHRIVLHGHDENSHLGNLLVQMYARCVDLDSARSCFECTQERNLISWNFLLKAYDGLGFYQEVLSLFYQMLEENVIPDKCTYVCILSAYATNPAAWCEGKCLHARILSVGLDKNFVVATAIVNLYGKCSDIEHACSSFESLLERDIVSWNALLAAYAQQLLDQDALQTFEQLHQEGFLPDRVTLLHVLCAFARPAMVGCGKRIHASLFGEDIENNVVVATALANMYGKCSSLKCARQLFDQMHTRNVVTWNAMIAVFAQHEHGKEALQLFKQMKLEDMMLTKVTFVSVLDACANDKCFYEGQVIHVLLTKIGFDVDVIVGTALTNMYNNCGRLQEGQRVFDLLPERNVISWNVMLTGFVHHGYGREALHFYDRMEREKIVLDELTAVEVLSACGLEAALGRGQVMHAFAVQCGFELEMVASNTILNMYGRCGCVNDAQRSFERMQERSLVSWNSIIALHAQHGNSNLVIDFFLEMEVQGVTPNETTLSNLMCMGSHAGLVRDCVDFWFIMTDGHNIYPTLEHFDCLVDILGRAGQLDEAEYLINKMPVQPSALSWKTLLSVCRRSADVARGKLAAETSFELDLGDEVTYITLFNTVAASGVWEDQVLHMVAG
ncbi:hypothetical protein L7F22_039756 [Adiantum nelumboides]|nr:hypothetical protein [Adiantum nelumboides]